jgi:hypothetical protein
MTLCDIYCNDRLCIAVYACKRVEKWNCKALKIIQWKLPKSKLLNFFCSVYLQNGGNSDQIISLVYLASYDEICICYRGHFKIGIWQKWGKLNDRLFFACVSIFPLS